ncbi:MAG: hypothetical protein DRP64_00595 [Verrucomicrobia bacterium]|nr:MAG: hypothetical protein DRP64_00595 [Verrucomicrobiota bacterium]
MSDGWEKFDMIKVAADQRVAIKPVFDKHGVELWTVIELSHRFQDRPGINFLKAYPPDLLLQKMKKPPRTRLISPAGNTRLIWI